MDEKVEPKSSDEIYNNNENPEENNQRNTEAGEENIQVKKTFDYLIPDESENVAEAFDFPNKSVSGSETDIYGPLSGQYKYAICILLKDNTFGNCCLLEETIKGIISNFGDLGTIQINPKDIFIAVFVNQIDKISGNEFLIKKDKLTLINKEKNFLKTSVTIKDETRDIKIDVINKKDYMTDIESLQCFYNYIIPKLKPDNKIIITNVITAGVIPTKNSLKKLIIISFPKKISQKQNAKNFAIVVPALEVADDKDLFIKIAQYDRVHFNLYTMNFYNSTASVPISSLFNCMIIDDQLMRDLQTYYNQIFINASIDYHDYNLSLTLYKKLYQINYYSNEKLGTIHYNNFNFSLYQENWINKFSGYFGNFFEIFRTFGFCENVPFTQKVFMAFQIIGILIEFIYPSLQTYAIYAIFYEAFNVYDISLAVFMTLLYLIIYLGSGACAMIKNRYGNRDSINLFFYLFMEVYYLLILICSIPAMNNINKMKQNSKSLFAEIYGDNDLNFYKFNKGACAVLIIFTFIISIIPLLLRMKTVMDNIAQMFIYLFLGAPSSTSTFLISKLWRAPETPGGWGCDDRKGITILIFFFFNIFFGFLNFYNNSRKKRANCVMGLAIFYLIYLFFKVIGILMSLLGEDHLANKSDETVISVIASGEINNVYMSKNELGQSSGRFKDDKNEEKLDEDENKNDYGNNSENNEDNNNEENNDNE